MTQPPATGPSIPSGLPKDPRSTVQAPALALMIIGGLYFLGVIYYLLNIIFGGVLLAWAARNGGFVGGGSPIMSVIPLAFSAIFGTVILLGGMKMRQLQSYPLALAASIVAMIPCTCCCIVGLPIGIWALVILLKPEVKAAFAP